VSRVALTLMLAASAVGVQASTASQAHALTIAQVDGGPHYYGQFSHPLPDDPGFFPIAGFLRPVHDANQVALYKDFGLNTISGLENPELTDEQLIRDAGMHAFVQADERTRFNGIGSETAGWYLSDEIDMCCGPPGFAGGNGYNILDSTRAGLPQDNRLRVNNYGKGVMFWESDSDAAKFVNNYQDVVSDDIYWFTDPNERSTPGYGVASSYGTTIDRMRYLDSLDGHRQPVWAVVELGWPFNESAAQGGRRILPAELRAAVWQSIIAGARGIIYFDHNFGPGTPDSTILGQGYADNRAMAKSVNAQIKSLAPVLNSPTVTSGWSQGRGTTAIVKWAGSGKAAKKRCKSKKGTKCKKKGKRKLYVFAGSAGSSAKGRFSLPCVGDGKAGVVGENRRVPVRGGSFRDRFASGNAIHIYRIDVGSKCAKRRQSAAAAVGHPGGDLGTSSNNETRTVLAAVVIILLALLACFGIIRRPGREPRPSGKRPKRSHHLGTR
jgi:hypothetical protein